MYSHIIILSLLGYMKQTLQSRNNCFCVDEDLQLIITEQPDAFGSKTVH